MIEYAFLIMFQRPGVISVTYPADKTLAGCVIESQWAIDIAKNNMLPKDKIMFFGCVDSSMINDIQKINDLRADSWGSLFSGYSEDKSGTFSQGLVGFDDCYDWMVQQPTSEVTGLYCTTNFVMKQIVHEKYEQKIREYRATLK